jgi:hypothetical protein
LFSQKNNPATPIKRDRVQNQAENTFATADWSARAISAHSSGEIVKGGVLWPFQ